MQVIQLIGAKLNPALSRLFYYLPRRHHHAYIQRPLRQRDITKIAQRQLQRCKHHGLYFFSNGNDTW